MLYSKNIIKYVLLTVLSIGFISCKEKVKENFSGVIKGNFKDLVHEQIRLEGFDGFKTYPIDNSEIDDLGNFLLRYKESDYGVGFLITNDQKPLIILLTGEQVVIQGNSLNEPESIRIIEGKENILFEKYAREHIIREQVLSAWDYLERIYSSDSLLIEQTKTFKQIQIEKRRIKEEGNLFLSNLPESSYINWFLPVRKQVGSVSTVAQFRQEEIDGMIKFFRGLDYTDPRLYKSGLLKEVIENHFWLIENSGKPLEQVFAEMKLSIEAIIENLSVNERIFNEVMDYLFDLLERHSLFEASEYLALKVLNESKCNIDNNLANQLETYRAMKIGNIAPDLLFAGDVLNKKDKNVSSLSDIRSEYTLVVFAAGWCPKCNEEIPELATLYPDLKNKGVEVLMVSLDNEKEAFINFANELPFMSICDYLGWNSPMAESYYVFSTPIMYLLDENREILLRPNSVKHLQAWVDWQLK